LSKKDMKTILITGASDGIGRETAKTLAAQGHKIIIHGRNEQKLRAVYDEIGRETGNENVDMFAADFLSKVEIRRFVDAIKAKYDRLDVLINNAGAQFGDTRETTAEGHEKTMMINVFAPFLLTSLLLTLLRKSPSARVVTVSSASHKMGGKPDLNDIELERGYSMSRAYGLSKLYVIWIMRRFAAMEPAVAFNTVHPGSVKTSLARVSMASWRMKIIMFLWKPMMISLAKGAKSSIEAAVSPALEGVTGRYFGPKGEEKPSDKYYSAASEQTLWNYCKKHIFVE